MSNQDDRAIESAYASARQRYAAMGVDTEWALETLASVSLSLHCWQGDDVSGFENAGEVLSGGIAATGNYPGKASSAAELRSDLDKAYSLIPGSHRLNLHAIYAETGGKKVDRDQLQPDHFSSWVDWARQGHHGLDFNPTLFSHALAASGFTLSSYDPAVRRFWIDHCVASRKIGAYFGQSLGSPAVTNIWIPDGYKDTPVDRLAPRALLKESLDQVLAEPLDPRFNLDAVEGKLFGLGAESYTVGSHEFYLGYAAARNATGSRLLLCLDSGHFHPTESIADKLSAVMLAIPELLLHVSRGVRWDSDHVVIFNDDLQAITQELVRGNFLSQVHIGLDYFDASINRVAAWVIGSRNTLRAVLMALLEPLDQLRAAEKAGDYTTRLFLLEELKGLPFGAVWDKACLKQGAPAGERVLSEIRAYEKQTMPERNSHVR